MALLAMRRPAAFVIVGTTFGSAATRRRFLMPRLVALIYRTLTSPRQKAGTSSRTPKTDSGRGDVIPSMSND